jgi:uridine phosphorylase
VLDKTIPVGHLLVPVSGVRDEGTSYAYQPPDWQAVPTVNALKAVYQTLQKHHAPYDDVITWTNDAIYRETRTMTNLRRKQGCRTVEMETSAFCAVAHFRGVEFAQILYGGDSVEETGWDGRDWISRLDIRERILWLAAEAVLAIP